MAGIWSLFWLVSVTSWLISHILSTSALTSGPFSYVLLCLKTLQKQVLSSLTTFLTIALARAPSFSGWISAGSLRIFCVFYHSMSALDHRVPTLLKRESNPVFLLKYFCDSQLLQLKSCSPPTDNKLLRGLASTASMTFLPAHHPSGNRPSPLPPPPLLPPPTGPFPY